MHEHPLRERLRGQRMLALYRAGRQADALAAYRSAREALVDGLGIEPSPSCARWRRRSCARTFRAGLRRRSGRSAARAATRGAG